ncbi:hypothetical protein Hanom_Chr14g01325131 [Helianthus anomalus]
MQTQYVSSYHNVYITKVKQLKIQSQCAINAKVKVGNSSCHIIPKLKEISSRHLACDAFTEEAR